MISASEALALPTAQLTAEENQLVDKLDADLDIFICKNMTRKGIQYQTEIVNLNVIAEVQQRLKRLGWQVQLGQVSEQHRLNKAIQTVVGHVFVLAPTDDAYRAASVLLSH